MAIWHDFLTDFLDHQPKNHQLIIDWETVDHEKDVTNVELLKWRVPLEIENETFPRGPGARFFPKNPPYMLS